MISSYKTKKRYLILRNPHFWIISAVTLILILLYTIWPWRESQIQNSLWKWFPWLTNLYFIAIIEIEIRIIGFLLLIPMTYAAIVFKWSGTVIFSIVSIAGILPLIISFWDSRTMTLITNICFLLVPVTITFLNQVIYEVRRRDRNSIIRERQKYTSLMLEAQEKERKRIAHELHDETIQTLVAIAKKSESILSSKEDKDVLWIKNEVVHTVDDLRRITLDLRPSILDDLGLIPALRWLVDRVNTESKINTQIQVEGIECKLSEYTEIAIFRIIQEALNNIKYHSKAKEAKVILDFGAQSFRIIIQDNGSGISPFEKFSNLLTKGKQGLIGIRERIELLGGHYQLHSNPGEGTTLLIEIKY